MEYRNHNKGLTLLELLIVSGFLIVALTGLLAAYILCLELAEMTRNANLALLTAQERLEEIRNSPFTGIDDYDWRVNDYSFQVPGMAPNESQGRVTVDSTDPALLNVTIGVCWRQKGNRIFGECQDSGGALAFLDSNGDNILDSPVQLSTLMAQR